jgi:tetratricopeptide (TPR) repeat protein/tRNA A-37 threonylcarbamoyl transferase component Bud32
MSSLSEATTGRARHRFEPGLILAGRYRILGPLRAGRLDEAYRAEDDERGEVVALKVLKRSSDPILASRILIRAQKRLSKLEHENVARVYDLGVHVDRDGAGDESSALFVTSELVEGESLGSFVRNARPLDRDLAMSLIDDICSGLEAVHRKRIVHGDLNSSAIVLVRDGDRLRPVVTDFAFVTGNDSPGAASIGSPVYRAPETIIGRSPDRSSDVFSLGVVIYEILSGRIPFTGGNLLALDFRSLVEEPRALHEIVDDLDPGLERVVARCLSRAPEDRYSDAGELRRAVRGEDFWTPRMRRNVGTLGAAAALVVVMLGGSALLDRLSDIELQSQVGGVGAYRPSFAILDMAPLGSQTEPWIGVALSELIRAEFSRDESVRVAEPSLVREYAGLTLPLSGAPGAELASRIRTLFDIEAIVIGTCSSPGTSDVPTVALDLCVIDSRTGETIAAAFERGSPEGLPELASRAASRLRAAIGLQESGTDPVRWDPDAVRPWAQGLLLLRSAAVGPAVERLEEAGRVQPANAHIQDSLALAWSEAGSTRRAVEAARRAIELSPGRSGERAMERSANLALLEGDLSRAIEERHRLARTFPDRTAHVYRLIDALLAAGATRPASDEIRRLRAARATVDPRTEIADARLHLQTGRFEQAALHAERAVAIAEAAGSTRLRGEAMLELAVAETATGRNDDALATLASAERLLGQGLDLSGMFRAASIRAGIFQRQGDLDAALAIHEALGQDFSGSGQQLNYATTLGSRSTILSLEGRHEEAIVLLKEAVDQFAQLGDEQNLVRSVGVLAGELLALGRLDAAREQFEYAAGIAARNGLRAWEGYARTGMARVAIEQLDLRSAESELARAAAIFGSVSLGSSTAGLDIVRSELNRLQGRLTEAESRLTTSVSGHREGLDRERQADLHAALAKIALSSGRKETAAALGERAAAHYAATGNIDREVDCLTIVLNASWKSDDEIVPSAASERLDLLAPRIESPLRSLRIRLARADGLAVERARAVRLAVFEQATARGLGLVRVEAAAALRDGASNASERARWSSEIQDLVRESGANLFLSGPGQ